MSYNAFDTVVASIGLLPGRHPTPDVWNKIPSVATIWAIQLGLGAAGLLFWPRRPVIAALVLVFAVANFLWIEFFVIGPYVLDVINQNGFDYVAQGPCAFLVCMAMHGAGAAVWWRRRRATPKTVQIRAPERAVLDGYVIGGMSLGSSIAAVFDHANTAGVDVLLLCASVVVATAAGVLAFRQGFSAGRALLLAALPWVLLEAQHIHVAVQHDLDRRMWTASAMDSFFGYIVLVMKGLFFGALGYLIARLFGVRGQPKPVR